MGMQTDLQAAGICCFYMWNFSVFFLLNQYLRASVINPSL